MINLKNIMEKQNYEVFVGGIRTEQRASTPKMAAMKVIERRNIETLGKHVTSRPKGYDFETEIHYPTKKLLKDMGVF